MKKAKARETRWQQAHPKAGKTYSPRRLYRGLSVAWSDRPGRTRIHPKGAAK